MEDDTLDDPISELITAYNELNSAVIDVLHEEPSPLEFLRYVARNTPFVVRKGAVGWEAFRCWDEAFLTSTLEKRPINVAVTPHGNADSPKALTDGTLALAKPHEEDWPFDSFLSTIIQQTRQDGSQRPEYPHLSPPPPPPSPPSSSSFSAPPGEVLYAQTQNDNLRNEYAPLFHLNHLPPSIPFARIALGQAHPDALNLWIGNARSVTALHRDNYENIYVQLRGRKRFVLLPPVCHPCVNEKPLRPATYRRTSNTSETRPEAGRRESNTSFSGLRLEEDEGGNSVPFATWDPDEPGVNATSHSHLAKPLRVTLEPGDMLYLPAMWYHKVSQFCLDDDEGFVLAVNYWYDMDFTGPLYPLSSLLRNLGSQNNSASTATKSKSR